MRNCRRSSGLSRGLGPFFFWGGGGGGGSRILDLLQCFDVPTPMSKEGRKTFRCSHRPNEQSKPERTAEMPRIIDVIIIARIPLTA